MGRKKSPTSEMKPSAQAEMPLAQRLKSLITDANELKDYLDCSIQAVNQFMCGASRPSLDNLCKIADFYNVSTDYLLGRADEPSANPDVQAACLTTGLSGAAIQTLMGLPGEEAVELDFLFTSESFQRFLGVLHEYREYQEHLLQEGTLEHALKERDEKEGKHFVPSDPESGLYKKLLRCTKLELHECISAITDAIDNQKKGAN